MRRDTCNPGQKAPSQKPIAIPSKLFLSIHLPGDFVACSDAHRRSHFPRETRTQACFHQSISRRTGVARLSQILALEIKAFTRSQ